MSNQTVSSSAQRLDLWHFHGSLDLLDHWHMHLALFPGRRQRRRHELHRVYITVSDHMHQGSTVNIFETMKT